ncbi:unnamed protein product [Rhizoctonia solani]|uniref:Uncharacterized protein n=1 Tax=Rhizoctonia solani TaxID=456999 RepID=A0A8H3BK45_9AGAM|nr:unnamed protein product [Rhizoctonia solani]
MNISPTMSGTFTVPHPNLERTKIIVLGDQSTGKTSLITRFMYDTFDEKYQATIGIDFLSKTMYLDDPVRLQLGTEFQERFRSLIPSYIRDSSVVITVYDITNRASFMSIGKWIDEVRSERPSNVMIVLVGNKADHSDKREVTVEEAIKLAGSLDIIFMETSAKTGHNVNTLFQKIAFSPMDMEKDGANVDRANSAYLV